MSNIRRPALYGFLPRFMFPPLVEFYYDLAKNAEIRDQPDWLFVPHDGVIHAASKARLNRNMLPSAPEAGVAYRVGR